VPEWDGLPLRYPVGIADLASLAGGAFSAAAFRSVPLFLYVGDTDENDPVPGWDAVDREAVFALTGVESGPIWPRWLVADEIHRGAAMDAARVVIYAGAGHTITSDMWNDLQPFFVDALPEPDTGLAAVAAAVALGALAARRGRQRR
jgi:hypothetical protein